MDNSAVARLTELSSGQIAAKQLPPVKNDRRGFNERASLRPTRWRQHNLQYQADYYKRMGESSMLPQEDRDALQQWQTENPDKPLTNENVEMLQKQLVSHPPRLAIRRFFAFVQASEETVRAKALEEEYTFSQDDRAMLQHWVTENNGKIPTNDVKLLQRKTNTDARLDQTWKFLVHLRKRDAERYVATCSAGDRMMLQRWQTEHSHKNPTRADIEFLQGKTDSKPTQQEIRMVLRRTRQRKKLERASAAITKDDKASLRHWQSQNLGKIPTAEDGEMLQAQMEDVSENHGFMIKRYMEDQRKRIRKKMKQIEMKSTGNDQVSEGVELENGYATVEEDWQSMGARALRGEV